MEPHLSPESLADSVCHVLKDLHLHPYPFVPSPPGCTKRASVALIIRVRPTYSHWPSSAAAVQVPDRAQCVPRQLDAFFSQHWARHGDPEVLFIKRASRAGDRWTGHIALPGGKRDPEDLDDKATAIREVSEEIGLDLTTSDCIEVGNLPERVVTTSWGTVPLMVLCPYVFLTTRPDSPMLRLQPSEVASTHWVSLRALLSPAVRTVEHVDVSERYARRSRLVPRFVYRSLMGWMQFSAIRLVPTESVHCSSIRGFVPDTASQPRTWLAGGAKIWPFDHRASAHPPLPPPPPPPPPLLLWGLTLGILADFLDMLPPHNAVQLWRYPTFTPPDLRLIVSVLTYRLRKRNKLRAKGCRTPNDTAADSTTFASPAELGSLHPSYINQVGVEGLGLGRHTDSGGAKSGADHAVGIMLGGYYDRLRVAVWVYLIWRLVAGSVGGLYLWRLLRRVRLSRAR